MMARIHHAGVEAIQSDTYNTYSSIHVVLTVGKDLFEELT